MDHYRNLSSSGCIGLRTKTRTEQTVFGSKEHTGVLNGMKRGPSVQNHKADCGTLRGYSTVQYDVASNHYLTDSCFTKTSFTPLFC
jgi:hypothetical protein